MRKLSNTKKLGETLEQTSFLDSFCLNINYRHKKFKFSCFQTTDNIEAKFGTMNLSKRTNRNSNSMLKIISNVLMFPIFIFLMQLMFCKINFFLKTVTLTIFFSGPCCQWQVLQYQFNGHRLGLSPIDFFAKLTDFSLYEKKLIYIKVS